MAVSQQVTKYACRECGWADFHPASQCPRCNGSITPSALSGDGRIVTFTTIRYAPRGFENQAPYMVAIIDLKEGLRVIGRISNPADKAKIGDPVSLRPSKEGTLEFSLTNSTDRKDVR